MGIASTLRLKRVMLHPMQQATESASSSSVQSFAGLLAALTAPASENLPPWSDEGLADDVATLSYENALRARTRYLASNRGDRGLTQPVGQEGNPHGNPPSARPAIDSYELAPLEEVPTAAAASSLPAPLPRAELRTGTGPEMAFRRAPDRERNLKSASVTIRLSRAECAQLHQRAAEAGLTVSAYLRSCTMEAENLRALVKETMAQLRTATAVGKQTAPSAAGGSRRRWLSRLFVPGGGSGRLARA
jgi:hypothetical protein